MTVSGLGRLAGKAAGTVGPFIGSAPYPETSDRTRVYYLDLMRFCLVIARQGE